MNTLTIDINCDVGEGVGNEALLMPYLSSCNIACGAHAGDEVTMRETIKLAINHKTKVGAHPSFPDRENFGRTEMSLPPVELVQVIHEQVKLFETICSELGARMNHIKPHGALYNMAAVDISVAESVVASHLQFEKDIFLYVPYGSVIADLAIKNGISIKYEVFADRNYNDNLSLVSRKSPEAILHESEEVLNHVLLMITRQQVKTISGNFKKIIANTICVHGDNPNAVEIVSYLHKKLQENKIYIEKG